MFAHGRSVQLVRHPAPCRGDGRSEPGHRFLVWDGRAWIDQAGPHLGPEPTIVRFRNRAPMLATICSRSSVGLVMAQMPCGSVSNASDIDETPH